MPPEPLVPIAAAAASAGRTTAAVLLATMVALQVGVVLILRHVFRPDDGDDDDRGSGGGGTKRRPRGGPPKPPPGEPVCWIEFERQFAEYVALSQGRGGRRERARRRAHGRSGAPVIPLDPGATPLVVVGVDRDRAEQDARASIAHAEQHRAV